MGYGMRGEQIIPQITTESGMRFLNLEGKEAMPQKF